MWICTYLCVAKHKKDRIMQRVWNLMFTSTGPIHLTILTHHRHNNIHNTIENNNTFSATHTHKQVYLFSPRQKKWHYMQQFCILLSKQYTQFKRRLCPITFYIRKKVYGANIGVGNLGLHLPPISLDSHQSQMQQDEILDWPHILIYLKDNSSFGWIRLITVDHFPIKAKWLDAPLALQVFSWSIAITPHY